MRFPAHAIASAALGFAIYRRQPRKLALLTLAGIALDFDHYLLYGSRSGDWSIAGALRYERRRHGAPARGDTRPRYGSLRSIAHRRRIVLPLAWLTAWEWPQLRPLALGLTLHLLMDLYLPHYDWRIWQRAGWRCERCGNAGPHLEVHLVVPPRRGGQRWLASNRALWCDVCAAAHLSARCHADA